MPVSSFFGGSEPMIIMLKVKILKNKAKNVVILNQIIVGLLFAEERCCQQNTQTGPNADVQFILSENAGFSLDLKDDPFVSEKVLF